MSDIPSQQPEAAETSVAERSAPQLLTELAVKAMDGAVAGAAGYVTQRILHKRLDDKPPPPRADPPQQDSGE